MVEYIVAIDVTRVRFPADASLCPTHTKCVCTIYRADISCVTHRQHHTIANRHTNCVVNPASTPHALAAAALVACHHPIHPYPNKSAAHGRGGPSRRGLNLHTYMSVSQANSNPHISYTHTIAMRDTYILRRHINIVVHEHTPRAWVTPPAGLEPAIVGLEVRRLVH